MIQRFINSRSAATSIEYCLIAGIISIAILSGATQIGQSLVSRFYGPLGGAFN